MFRRTFAFSALALLAGGCARAASPDTVAPHSAGTVFVFTCEKSAPFTARFSPDSVEIDLATRVVTLGQTIAASGTKYVGDGYTFWSKGLDATFETPEGTDQCRGRRADSPWEAARLRGATLRAVGQEPGWTLEIVPGRWIHYRGDYGQVNVFAPVPEPASEAGETVYRAQTDARPLIVRTRRAPCQDTMSGEMFELAVTVEVDGRRYQGCGRNLSA